MIRISLETILKQLLDIWAFYVINEKFDSDELLERLLEISLEL